MEKNTFFGETQNLAQNYYPKALCLGQEEPSPASPRTQSSLPNLLSSLMGQTFSPQSLQSQFSKMFADNPLLSVLLSGSSNQSDLMSKLLSPSSSKPEKPTQLSVDISDSVEEL